MANIELGNTPNYPLMKLLDEAIALNTDPKVGEKLQQLKLKNANLDEYLESNCSEESELQKRIMQDTNEVAWEDIHAQGLTSGPLPLLPFGISGRLEGQFLKIIAELIKAEKILDIGMYTGYSAISFCETSSCKQVVSLENEGFCETFVKDRIKNTHIDKKLRIMMGPALSSLEKLKSEGMVFDLVFLDADKMNYPNYYKFIMDNGLLKPGGTILVDNALLFGLPYPKPTESWGIAVAELNEIIRNDDRVEQVLLPLRDGINLVRLKQQ